MQRHILLFCRTCLRPVQQSRVGAFASPLTEWGCVVRQRIKVQSLVPSVCEVEIVTNSMIIVAESARPELSSDDRMISF
ncbi:hypothetical protein F0562_035178 [Nyssa sinensis]|uniref:Uncharacterized protein n=1 Tax=Nyssa sinensis TaxID=561372 RepID=A0A5J5AAG2_9ASTE|nr:hypothetical protein F0562_035178 [Nyssa sinensis]